MTINLDGFTQWMADEGLAETTRAQRLVDARRIVAVCLAGDDPPVRLHFAAVTLSAWADEEGVDLSLLEPQISHLTSPETKKAAVKLSRRRKSKPRSFDPAAWKRLARAIVQAETPEARVLEVVMVTGLRIGDVLRIEHKQVKRAVEEGVFEVVTKGGKVREIYVRGRLKTSFEKLLDTWSSTKGGSSRPNVATWILPESRDPRPYFGAYQRVSRKLKNLAAKLGLDGRIHLHRMRRTIAMQALSATKDIGAVQQLLGHESIATTQRYLDEERPEDVAALHDTVHKTFLDEEE